MLPRDGMAEREARLRRAHEASGIYAFEVDADRVAHCDDGLRALFGLPPGTRFDVETWAARLHPEDRDRTRAEFTRLWREGGPLSIEFRAVTPDGTIRWLQSRAEAAPGAPGQPRGVFGMTMDITARREMEEALRASRRELQDSEARLSMALESTTDSVLTLAADWRVPFLNRRAAAQIANGEDLRGRMLWDTFPDAVGGPVWQALHRCMQDREPTEAEQFYAPLGRHFATRAFPAEDGGITVFFRDVTREREATARPRRRTRRLGTGAAAGRPGGPPHPAGGR